MSEKSFPNCGPRRLGALWEESTAHPPEAFPSVVFLYNTPVLLVRVMVQEVLFFLVTSLS